MYNRSSFIVLFLFFVSVWLLRQRKIIRPHIRMSGLAFQSVLVDSSGGERCVLDLLVISRMLTQNQKHIADMISITQSNVVVFQYSHSHLSFTRRNIFCDVCRICQYFKMKSRQKNNPFLMCTSSLMTTYACACVGGV